MVTETFGSSRRAQGCPWEDLTRPNAATLSRLCGFVFDCKKGSAGSDECTTGEEDELCQLKQVKEEMQNVIDVSRRPIQPTKELLLKWTIVMEIVVLRHSSCQDLGGAEGEGNLWVFPKRWLGLTSRLRSWSVHRHGVKVAKEPRSQFPQRIGSYA